MSATGSERPLKVCSMEVNGQGVNGQSVELTPAFIQS